MEIATKSIAPRVLHWTRGAAVVITAAIGVGSFYLSWASLSDLAARVSVSAHAAWVWPLIVDGAILMATMAIVALAPYADQRGARGFFWLVLAGAAAVTIVCNALHAVMFRPAGVNPFLAAAIAVVPPIMLLLSAHGLSLLMQVRIPSQAGSDDTSEHEDQVGSDIVGIAAPEREPITATQRANWLEMADEILEQLAIKDTKCDRGKVADVLYLSYERELTNRAIGRHVDLDHRVVGKIVAASSDLLRSGRMAIGERDMVPRRAVSEPRHAELVG